MADYDDKTWVTGEGEANARLNDDSMNNLEARVKAGFDGSEIAGAAAAAQAASQPLDPDLTALAALTTTAYGRAFLELANAAATRTAIGAKADTSGLYGTWWKTPVMGAVAGAAPGSNVFTYGQITIPHKSVITGMGFWISAQNGNVKSALYDSAGTKVAEATSTLAVASGNTFQKVPFDSTYTADAGVYFGGIVFSGTGGIYSASGLAPGGTASPGSFINPGSITPPTTPRAVGAQAVLTTY